MQTNNEKAELLLELRRSIAAKQKKGLHFILTSVTIWLLLSIIHALPVCISLKNTLSIVIFAFFVLIAQGYAKLIGTDFFDRTEPLMPLAFLVAIAQLLYIPISLWTFYAAPERMLMMIAIVSGAHLLPFAWIYRSKTYLMFSILIPIISIIVGWRFSSSVLAFTMLPVSAIFCLMLALSLKH